MGNQNHYNNGVNMSVSIGYTGQNQNQNVNHNQRNIHSVDRNDSVANAYYNKSHGDLKNNQQNINVVHEKAQINNMFNKTTKN